MPVVNADLANWSNTNALAVMNGAPSWVYLSDGDTFKACWNQTCTLQGNTYDFCVDYHVNVHKLGSLWIKGNGIQGVQAKWPNLAHPNRINLVSRIRTVWLANRTQALRDRQKRAMFRDAVQELSAIDLSFFH